MEGFLLKKGRGESKMFGRRNWKKRWVTLDGQYLTYYEDFDTTKNEAVNKKGTAVVRGCKISVVDHQDKKFCFVVSHESRTPLYLCAEKEKIMFMWIKALENASEGKCGGPVNVSFDEFFAVLDMDKAVPYTSSMLNKAYRKAALKNHPDKGGDVDAFKKVQEAFEILQNKLEEDEQAKLYHDIQYTATIEKGRPGVGFGMVVVEDSKKGAIIAKDILPAMLLRRLGPEAKGKMKKGDRIVMIDNDDIATWTLARVVQRLNDFRAPVGSEVRFTFSRKVRIDGGDDEEEEGANEAKASHDEDTHVPPSEHANEPQSSYQDEERPTDRDGDGDDGHFRFSSRASFIEDRNSGFGRDAEEYASADIDEDDAPPPPSSTTKPPAPHVSRVPAASRKSDWGQDPMVQAASLQAENEELVQRMQEMEKELMEMTRERDKYRSDAADWRMKFDTANHEKIEFLRQLGEAEEECQELERRERNALDLLEQFTDQGHMSAELAHELEKNVLEAAHVVQSGQMFPNEDGGLARRGSVEAAVQAARSAASFVDTSGRFVEKLDQSDSSALFLKRLEDSVLRQYGNSSAYDNGEDSDSLSEDGQSQHRRAPYNPTGYAPHLTNSRASASGAPLNQKLKMSQAQPPGNRSNPLVQRQGSGPSSPPQRGPGKPGGRGQAQQRSSGSGRPSASSQQGLHSPIKHMPPQSQGIPYSGQQMQSQHQQGPYEYQPPSRSRNSEATIHAEGARERKLNMLSQPTASSRARVTIDGNAIGRSEAPPRQGLSKRSDTQGMNFSTRGY